MNRLWRLLRRFRNFLTGRRLDARLREELAGHLARQTEANLGAGLPAAEARRRAALQLGSVEAVRDQYHAEAGLPAMENLLRDARYALRQLRKSPGLAASVVLTLALGVGALVTVTLWTNAVVFDPWPQVASADAMRFVDATVGNGGSGYSVHYDELRYVRDNGRSFTGVAAMADTDFDLAITHREPTVLHGGVVSSNYFALLGLRPERGRFFQANADDLAYGAQDAVVLSDALWRSQFGADPGAVGRTLMLNQHPFTVVGIAPRGFLGIFGGFAESAWVPLSGLRDLSPDAPADPLHHYGLQGVVRLRPGVSGASAQAELHTLASSFAAQHPGEYNGWTLNLHDAAHFGRGWFYTIAAGLPLLAGASGLLLLLVLLNVAALLAQQAAKKRREVAIRTALGAAPRRIASQLLIEAGMLAAAGALGGWAAGLALSRTLYALLPHFGFPFAFNLQNDWRVDAVAIGAAVAVTLLCGLAPVRQALRVPQQAALHDGGATAGTPRQRRGRRLWLGVQMGICFMVLVGCGLLTRTALNIIQRGTGFNPRGTLTATLELSRAGVSQPRAQVLLTRLLAELRRAPGVAAATLTTHLPMGGNGSYNSRSLSVPGYVPAHGEDMDVTTDFDGPNFFHTMGIPLREGRDFTSADDASAPKVAIINQAMAQRYWPHGDALGRPVAVHKVQRQIVGIVPNFTYQSPEDTDPSPVAFLPYLQGPTGYGYAIIAVRSRTTADAVASALRRAVAGLDPKLPLEQVQSLRQMTDSQYDAARLPAELLGVYALASLVVALMGMYAVMAYAVTERQREFALRMALGSTPRSVLRLVLRSAASIVALGLVIGGIGSLAAMRLLSAMLFGVSPFDAATYAAAAVLLLAATLLAGLIPARRAAAADPMRLLRSE
ncbi:MAG: ADOP family duplicated permease [Terriglobales bacterium]